MLSCYRRATLCSAARRSRFPFIELVLDVLVQLGIDVRHSRWYPCADVQLTGHVEVIERRLQNIGSWVLNDWGAALPFLIPCWQGVRSGSPCTSWRFC